MKINYFIFLNISISTALFFKSCEIPPDTKLFNTGFNMEAYEDTPLGLSLLAGISL